MADGVPDNFLGLDARRSAYDTARFAILPIPYDATTSYGVGTREGPRAIITASQQVELYDEALGRESHTAGVTTLPAVEPDSRGPEATLERVYRAARPAVRAGKFVIGLGGEHSVSYGLVRAAAGRYKDLSVLQIDAHADLREEYQGSPYSHACVMRRILDLGLPCVGVGIRNYCRAEARFIRSNDVPLYSARTCHESPTWIEDVVANLGERVYITIDIDGFDPAYAPGTGTPEPGGLDWYQVTDLLAAVTQARRVVGADVVEVRPLPPANVTEFLAARLVYRLIGLVTQAE